MKQILRSSNIFAMAVLLALAFGCASTRQTEQMLTEAGFKRVVASTPQQEQHLKTLPVDKVTVARFKGKILYVYPDPAHHLIYVGNLGQYQAYQQILMDKQVSVQSRVMADLGEDDGDDDVQWAVWTNNTGWVYGSD
jgi:hypothetical protein